MAGVSNKSLRQFSCDIVFDGALLSSTRASLVIELIKYFLYERQQIPLPVDQLKNTISSTSGDTGLSSNSDTANVRQPQFSQHQSFSQPQKAYLEIRTANGSSTEHYCQETSRLSRGDVELENEVPGPVQEDSISSISSFTVHKFASRKIQDRDRMNQSNVLRDQSSKIASDRKAKCFLGDLTQMFDDLHKAFESCPEIEQVAVIFGGTVVSPKESYLINFPPPCPDADCLPLTACKRRLFQEIISEDILGSMKNISPTNMMLLVSAPRSCPLQGFLPKHSLHSPRTGAVISFNLHCTYLVPICHDLSYIEGAFELSGIEPLDCSQCEKDSTPTSQLSPENMTELADKEVSNSEPKANVTSTLSEKEFILFRRLGEERSNKHEAIAGDVCQSKIISRASPSVSLSVPRFCQHQKLSYIFTHRKKTSQLDSSSDDLRMPLSHLTTPNFSTCGSAVSNFEARICASPVVKSEHPTNKSDDCGEAIDCIWYQSPFTIKGFKCQDSSNGNFKCF